MIKKIQMVAPLHPINWIFFSSPRADIVSLKSSTSLAIWPCGNTKFQKTMTTVLIYNKLRIFDDFSCFRNAAALKIGKLIFQMTNCIKCQIIPYASEKLLTTIIFFVSMLSFFFISLISILFLNDNNVSQQFYVKRHVQ